jgi:hypothetical protein
LRLSERQPEIFDLAFHRMRDSVTISYWRRSPLGGAALGDVPAAFAAEASRVSGLRSHLKALQLP